MKTSAWNERLELIHVLASIFSLIFYSAQVFACFVLLVFLNQSFSIKKKKNPERFSANKKDSKKIFLAFAYLTKMTSCYVNLTFRQHVIMTPDLAGSLYSVPFWPMTPWGITTTRLLPYLEVGSVNLPFLLHEIVYGFNRKLPLKYDKPY